VVPTKVNRRRPAKQADGPQLVAAAVTITSAPESATAPPALKVDGALIDRAGIVKAILADFAVQVKPFKLEDEALEEKALDELKDLPADGIYVGEGDHFRIDVGMQAEKQEYVEGGVKQALEWLGQDVFLLICQPDFGKLKAVLPKERYEQIVKKMRNGNRTVKVVAKAAPQPLKAA
jgi:hypothetical protein